MTCKTDKQAEVPSRLAHELLLNTLEKLAEDDSDPELAQRVQRERAKLGISTPAFGVEQFEALKQEGKPRPAWQRRWTLTVCAAASMIAYLALTTPDGLAIRSDGSVSGFFNILREKVQGQSFWQQQLDEARAALDWELAAPERQAEFNRRSALRSRSLDQTIEDMYQRHPSLRPSPAEQYAEALREEADRIEAAELDRRLEESRIRRIAELETIVDLLKKR